LPGPAFAVGALPGFQPLHSSLFLDTDIRNPFNPFCVFFCLPAAVAFPVLAGGFNYGRDVLGRFFKGPCFIACFKFLNGQAGFLIVLWNKYF
jgi:hypothetical protein